MSTGKEIKHWADEAMFKAEPVDTAGPKVYLLEMTSDPLGSIAALSAMYTGKVTRSKDDVTDEERDHHLREMQLTKLTTPLEAVKLHFMIEGVTRAFTHQLVRNRTSAYAQESMRFAVKEDMPVALPPSLAGVPVPVHTFDESFETDTQTGQPIRSWHDAFNRLSDAERNRVQWDECVENIRQTYNILVNRGMPAEDARGLAPTNVLTRINWVTDLRTLISVLDVRLCTQAQFEWRQVANLIARAIADGYKMDRRIVQLVGEQDSWSPTAWERECNRVIDEYRALAGLFRPICYRTGKCEFNSDADRACSIRDRVTANHLMSRPSSEWHKSFTGSTVTQGGAADGFRITEHVDAIRPEEWMLDPAAARRP